MEFKGLLTKVEDSQRQGTYSGRDSTCAGDSLAIYESRKNIAKYFHSLEIYDVAISYFNEALDIALKSGASSLVEMEATLNLGKALEGEGEIPIDTMTHQLCRKAITSVGIL